MKRVILIDRVHVFDPVSIGKSYSVMEEETDTRSTALTKVNLTKIRFKNMLRSGEGYVAGEEKLRRLKSAGYIRLDEQVFCTLWENQSLIPKSWEKRTGVGITYICFEGTLFESSHRGDGKFHALVLYWDGSKWCRTTLWLGNACYPSCMSAVLEK